MNHSAPHATTASPLNEQDILAYLLAHPNFLVTHPELLDSLTPPGQKTGGKSVVDFQQFMVTRLQSNYDWLKQQHRELIANSRANLDSLSQIHAAVLMMLEADSFKTLIHVITQEFPIIFGVDAVNVLIESPSPNQPDLYAAGVQVVQPGMTEFWLEGKATQCDSNIEGDPILFGPAAALVQSQLLLRLEVTENIPLGMLVFGSRDPILFHEGHSTELVVFLARAIERCIRWWLEMTEA